MTNEQQQHAGSQQRASSQPLAGAMVVGMVDADGLPLLGRVRMVGVSSGGVVVLDLNMSVCMRKRRVKRAI